MKRQLGALALLVTLAGCAASPQQVRLQPQIDVNSHLTKQPSVHLSVNDTRGTRSLGTRGGVYASSNHITPARNLSDSLRPAAAKALTELGARVDTASPMPVKLALNIEQLSYQVNDGSTLPMQITLDASIRAVASKGDRQFSGRYESSKQHKFFKAPSEETNEEIINEILSDTLTRVFNDPKLLTFMEQ